jgi:hypothetical protein
VPTFRQPSPTFFQEGADLGQAAADAGQPLDGLLGLAGGARRVGQEVVLQRAVVPVQFAGLAPPAEAANPVQAAFCELVEVALDGPGRDVGQFGDVRVGEALALQPQDFHLALDPRVRMVIPIVAYLRQDFFAEDELAHGCLPAIGTAGYNHAVGIGSPCGNSASLSREEYNNAGR